MKKLWLVLIFFSLNSYSFDHTHQKFQKILDVHLKTVKNQTLINYKNLKISPVILNDYLKEISLLNKESFDVFSKEQQVAFLINAYNAYTISWILKNYPVKSIKDTTSFFSNPWKKDFFSLLGKKTTLHEIEHEMLRKNYNLPRIHFAIVCASLSCPNLLPNVYKANILETQLNEAATLFLTDKAKNLFNKKNHSLYLSKIFDWYEDDFKKKYKSIKALVALYMTTDPKERKQINNKNIKIKYLNYDWGLNAWEK